MAELTERRVEALKATGTRYVVNDVSHRGQGTLIVRVGATGLRTFAFRYYFDGRVRILTIGTYPLKSLRQARNEADDAMRKVRGGLDPASDTVLFNKVALASVTFRGLANAYIEQHALRKKKLSSIKTDRGMLKKHLLPAFGAHKASAITRQHVRNLLDKIVTRPAPIQANRVLALLRKIYNFGMVHDYVSHNPCDRLPAPSLENKRDRVLSEAEIRSLLSILPTANMAPAIHLALKFQLLTAQRGGEVTNLRWDELDLASGWWTIPAAKAKNGRSHRVPLSSQALAVLDEARRLAPDAQNPFGSPVGDRPMDVTAVCQAVRRNRPLFDAAKIAKWTPHDLRRSAATHMVGAGVRPDVVGKILNHADSSVTAVYVRHSYDAEKRSALETWGRVVDAIAAGRALVAGLPPVVDVGSW